MPCRGHSKRGRLRSLRPRSASSRGRRRAVTNPAPEPRPAAERSADEQPKLCPSAQPDMEGSVAFGIVEGTAEEPSVSYFRKPLPVTPELLQLSRPVRPTEVFRFAAPCAEGGCQHFDGARCRLAHKVAETVPTTASDCRPAGSAPRAGGGTSRGEPRACGARSSSRPTTEQARHSAGRRIPQPPDRATSRRESPGGKWRFAEL